MKNELGGKIMTEFVALRAKMYTYRKIDKGKKCAAKAEKSVWFLKDLCLKDHKTCLLDGETIYGEQMLFEKKKHEVYTVNKRKIVLNKDDDKRLVQGDGMTTLPWGYAALAA